MNKENSWVIERKCSDENNPYFTQKQQVEIISPVIHINKIYNSNSGPVQTFYFKPDNSPKSELIWLTDYSVQVLDKENQLNLPQNFIGHSNLDIAFSELVHRQEEVFSNRLAMVSQGHTAMHIPDGFGLPFLSLDNISVTTQAVNYNLKNDTLDIRHKIILGFIRNKNIKKALKPLFKRTINVFVPVSSADPIQDSLNGSKKNYRPADSTVLFNQQNSGERYTGHWLIPQITDTVKFNVTSMIHLNYNTTLHYASVHVQPYCISLSLKDLTTGTVIFSSHVKNNTANTGIENIDNYSGSEGIPMFADHKYELICITNNTSNTDQDMIAGMILYFYDKVLEKKLGTDVQLKR